MFSHIMVGANDIEESKTFYDNVLGVLGAKPGIHGSKSYWSNSLLLFFRGNDFLYFRAY